MSIGPPSCNALDRRLADLQRVFTLLDDRVDELEADLDCHVQGSIAQAFVELRAVCDLRACVEEWTTGRARRG